MTADLSVQVLPDIAEASAPSTIGQSRRIRVGLITTAILLLATILLFPQWFATHEPDTTDLLSTFSPPSTEHFLGTDQLGRDVFSRIVFGARLSIAIGVLATVIGVVGGSLLGSIAVAGGRRIDAAVMRLVDALLAFPELLLALLVVAVVGGGFLNVAVAIGFAAVPNFARLVRGQARVVIRSEYVEAAKVLGVPPWRYIPIHVLPNVGGPVIVLASIGMGSSIIAGAGLSVLGLGPRPPQADWGSMIADGKDYLDSAWWISVTPGIAVVLLVITVTLMGRSLHSRGTR